LSPLNRKSPFDVLPGRGKQHVKGFDCAIMTGVTDYFHALDHRDARALHRDDRRWHLNNLNIRPQRIV